MTFRLSLSLRLSCTLSPIKLLALSCLKCNFSSPISDPVLYTRSLIGSTQNPAKSIADQLANCTNLSELNQIHAHIIRTQILYRYPDPFYWNNIIRSYTRLNATYNALCVYLFMSRAGVLPDYYTLPIALKAAIQCFDLCIGKQFFSLAMKLGLVSNEFCESGFINLYCKAGEFENARKVFDENPDRKLGSWNAIVGGFTQGGRAKEAVSMFIELKKTGLQPDDVTMVCVTSACGSLGDINLAQQLHKCYFQAKPENKSDIMMLNSLIDMYGKCGKMDLANKVFSEMEQRNVLTWTSMIVGYAANGQVIESLNIFQQMIDAGIRPNHITFVGVLTACAHGGKVEEGKDYFKMMREQGIEPRLQHYGCMVDLLGRAGLLKEAKEMIEEMPMKANVVIWGCLMGACEKHGDVEIGEVVAKHLIELEPWNDGAYVVLSNVYANRGLWSEVERVREIMKERKLVKLPAYSIATKLQ